MTKEFVLPPGYIRSILRTEDLWREIDKRFGLLAYSQVKELMPEDEFNRSMVSEAEESPNMLRVLRVDSYRYPGFQFESDGTVKPVIQRLINLMRQFNRSEESLTLWLCSPSTYFYGSPEPVHHLDEVSFIEDVTNYMKIDW